MDDPPLKEIASQLSCPQGESGIATGEKMNSLNNFITQKAIEHLAPKQVDSIVEIGPGNSMLAVNILLFIGDLPAFFAHIKQWLKPNGRTVFGVRSPETLSAMPFTQYGFSIRTIESMEKAMIEAGFKNVESTHYNKGMSSFEGIEISVNSVIIKGTRT